MVVERQAIVHTSLVQDNRQTDQQMDKQTNRLTDQQMDKQTNRQTERPTDVMRHNLSECLWRDWPWSKTHSHRTPEKFVTPECGDVELEPVPRSTQLINHQNNITKNTKHHYERPLF